MQTGTLAGLVWNNSVSQTNDFLTLLVAVGWVESRYRQERVSPAGAVGIMQVTAIAHQDVDSSGRLSRQYPAHNVRLGSRYLAQALQENGGNVVLALIQYNAGYAGVIRARSLRGVPDETAHYTQRVLTIYSGGIE